MKIQANVDGAYNKTLKGVKFEKFNADIPFPIVACMACPWNMHD
ncbi:hypothetical protein [Arcanobacterium phocae]|nr:hypothetical protein [Arcanobacterium phocae]